MKFRKRPVVIDAWQLTDIDAMEDVCHQMQRAGSRCSVQPGREEEDYPPVMRVTTLEGVMEARMDDWIIKGVAGEFYPCKDAIFRQTYEPVEIDSAPEMHE